MSCLFTVGPRLHVYLTQDPEKTGCFEKLRQFAFTHYDRDVVVDLCSVEAISEHGVLILLSLNEILQKGGHKLILLNPSVPVRRCLVDHKISQLFAYEEHSV